MGDSFTVEYREARDKDWVFAKQTEKAKEASAKANSLWDNPSVVEVQIVQTTRSVWKSKSRTDASTERSPFIRQEY